VGFGAQRPKAHAGSYKALADFVDAFDFGERGFRAQTLADFQEIAQLDWLAQAAIANHG
jgi:hypothetical protein